MCPLLFAHSFSKDPNRTPGIVLDAGTVTPRICPSGATDRVCACTCMHVLGEPITMKFEEPAFLERSWNSEQGIHGQEARSVGGVGRASWKKCQWLLRTLSGAGCGQLKLLVVEKLKVVMKAWSWARGS